MEIQHRGQWLLLPLRTCTSSFSLFSVVALEIYFLCATTCVFSQVSNQLMGWRTTVTDKVFKQMLATSTAPSITTTGPSFGLSFSLSRLFFPF